MEIHKPVLPLKYMKSGRRKSLDTRRALTVNAVFIALNKLHRQHPISMDSPAPPLDVVRVVDGSPEQEDEVDA